MSAEELSRIFSWVIGSGIFGFGVGTTEALLDLVQPETIGAFIVAGTAIWKAWRVFRPPVVKAAE